jgi:hypothetical protein
MTLTSYSGLTTALAAWLARDGDPIVSAAAPDLVALAEQRIFYGSEDPQFPSPAVRVRQMETTVPLSTVAGTATVALPTGWLGAKRLYIDGDPDTDLVYMSPEELRAAWPNAATTKPVNYTIEGENIVFGPTPDAVYTVQVLYWQKPDPLATTPTNALLTAAPSLYLYAALLEAALWNGDDAAATRWLRMFSAAANALHKSDRRERHSGSALVMGAGMPVV